MPSGEVVRLAEEGRDDIEREDRAVTFDLVQAWATAWEEVEPEARLLATMVSNGDAAPGVVLADQRARKALAIIATELQQLADRAGTVISQRIAQLVGSTWARELRMIAASVPASFSFDWSRVDRRAVEAIVKRSTQRIVSLTRPLAPDMEAAIRREMIRGVSLGSNPTEVARRTLNRLEDAFNGGLPRAMVIARTEMMDAHREAARQADVDNDEVLDGWEWLASLTPRTCRGCWGMHGTFHPTAEPGPYGHPQCRCTRIPKVKSYMELGIPQEEPDDLMPDAQSTFDALPEQAKKSILGKEGYALYQQGKFPRSEWARMKTNQGWRQSVVSATPRRS